MINRFLSPLPLRPPSSLLLLLLLLYCAARPHSSAITGKQRSEWQIELDEKSHVLALPAAMGLVKQVKQRWQVCGCLDHSFYQAPRKVSFKG